VTLRLFRTFSVKHANIASAEADRTTYTSMGNTNFANENLGQQNIFPQYQKSSRAQGSDEKGL
jgi:hypothetical protein